jgi:Ca2+-transporting ATPase
MKVAIPTSRMPLAELAGRLSSAEATILLRAEGPNELPQANRRSALLIVGEVIREPMLALLLAGGVAYLLLGDFAEAVILLAFATFSIAVTVIQETRTEHVLEALRDLSAPRALVIRDSARVRIAGREVVRSDILVLEQGDRIAADAILLTADDLQVDESLLTGESLPVRKLAASGKDSRGGRRPGGEDQPNVYSGSLVTRATGLARVIATGPSSEIGRIGQSLATLDTEPPRLRQETADREAVRDRRWRGGAPRGAAVRAAARRLALRGAGRHRHRHVDAARGISGGPHHFPGDGGLAHRPGRRAHPPRRRH